MTKFGKDLIFISQIKRDGSGVDMDISKDYIDMMEDDLFRLTTLSLSENTFIASEFNSFVVKLKYKKL